MYNIREIWEAQLLSQADPEVEKWVDKITTEIYNLVIDDPSRDFICFEPWSEIGTALYNNKEVQRRLIMLGFKVDRFDWESRSDYYTDPSGEYWPGVCWKVSLPPDLYGDY